MTTGLPLDRITVVAFEAIGPVPFACQLLQDMGADVISVARPPGARGGLPGDLAPTSANVGSTIVIDCNEDAGAACAMQLIASADVVIEGFRPGVMERLGLGPAQVHERNPAVVYARVTGWGQTGPYARTAGHDINYIGLTGALAAIGPPETPIPPLNLVGDYAGGSMFAIAGILAALVARARTGVGDVVDVAMIDGAGALLQPIRALASVGLWGEDRTSNLLDGGAPFYRAYSTADSHFMAVGALESTFYSEFVSGLGLVEDELPNRFDTSNWPDLVRRFAEVFAAETRDHWVRVFTGTDACVTPILAMSEVMDDPHNTYRDAVIATDSGERPAPAPRFTATQPRRSRQRPSSNAREILVNAGVSGAEVDRLLATGVIHDG